MNYYNNTESNSSNNNNYNFQRKTININKQKWKTTTTATLVCHEQLQALQMCVRARSGNNIRGKKTFYV